MYIIARIKINEGKGDVSERAQSFRGYTIRYDTIRYARISL